LDGPKAVSTGYYPKAGRSTSAEFLSMALQFGIDLQDHRSQIVTEQSLEESDLIFVMGEENLSHLKTFHPEVLTKTFNLGLLTGPEYRNIPDPYGLSGKDRLASYQLIKKSLDVALDRVLVTQRAPTHPLRIFIFHAVVSQECSIQHYCFVKEDLFRQQIDLISQHFSILPLTEAVAKMQRADLTEPTAAITFDDGFMNNHTFAFPELIRGNIPATVFVSTGFTDSDQTVWFCRILRALSETTLQSLEWNGFHYDLSCDERSYFAANEIMGEMKKLAPEEIETVTDRLEIQLGFEARAPVALDSPFRMLTAQAIREMSDSGLVDFGGHTNSHAILSRLGEDRQREEVNSSIELLNGILGRETATFAYPNGGIEDYDQTSKEILHQAGISIALTAMPGENNWQDGTLDLLREGVGPSDDPVSFDARLRRLTHPDGRQHQLKP
jgi:protein-tyrosine-phosphatase/peptidoglycan/xylan/chitin deacetylase (PgdA/CDA1 family)